MLFRSAFVPSLLLTESWPALSSDWIVWSSSPPGIVDIDQDGNAVMLKGGDAQIVVTERETSPVMATAKIKVVP